MKKLITMIISAALLLGAFTCTANAATIDDVVAAVAANPLLSYLEADVRNVARNYDFTSEQCDTLISLINAFNADVDISMDDLGNIDLGSMSAEDIVNKGVELMGDACGTLDFNMSVSTPTDDVKDTVITVTDKEGDVVHVLDLNVIRPTGFDTTSICVDAPAVNNAPYVAAIAVFAAALAVVLLQLKKAKADK
ncbi:MAG: hypothetical protein IJ499_04060 [Clostridia bacterium]|nr:hypothetical protein [Clostridia bacterium]